MSKIIKKYFFMGNIFVLFCLASYGIWAAPSLTEYIEQQQPSGETFKVTQQGDEWFSYTVSQSGDLVIKGTDGYWYYALDQQGTLVESTRKYLIQVAPANALTTADVARVRQEKMDLLVQIQNGNNTGITNSSGMLSPTLGPALSSPYSSAPLTGNQKVLVLLVSLSNAAITTSESAWHTEFFGTSGKTVRTYYNEVSGGTFSFIPAEENSGTVNDGIIKVTLNYNHPNTGSSSGTLNQLLVHDALVAANGSVDFSSYDTNNNGSIDYNELHIVTIIAGYEAAANQASYPNVWAHHYWLTNTAPTLDGVAVSKYPEGGYVQLGELHQISGSTYPATIGIICHELGHDIGLPDLYDTSGDDSEGVGQHSLMGSGNWTLVAGEKYGETPSQLDAWCKVKLGFVTPITVTNGSIQVKSVLNSSGNTNGYNVFKVPTDNSNEYFLVENRQFYGFDKGLENYAGSSGIAIWHIDESVIAAKTASNQVNGDENRKGVDLEEANEVSYGGSQLDTENIKNWYHNNYFYSGNNMLFSPYTTPNSKLYNGANTWISIGVPGVSSSTMFVQVNHVPIGVDNNYKVVKNMSLITTPANGILLNDTDSDGNPITATNITNVSPAALGTFTSNSDGSFTFVANNITGTAVFTYTPNDGYADGNPASVSILVYEDMINPTVAAVTLSPATPTSGSVTLSITATDLDSGIPMAGAYSFDAGVHWQDSNSLTYTENTTLPAFSIRVKDASGNIGMYASSVVISNIDKAAPSISSVALTPITPTNGSVTLVISANDIGSGIATTNGYSFDGGVTWQTSNAKIYTHNTTISALSIQVKDVANNIAQYNSETLISNIDQILPSIESVTMSPLTTTNGSVTITITAVDNESGIAISNGYSFDGGITWQTSAFKEYDANTTIPTTYIRVKDLAGNVTSYAAIIAITNIDKPPVLSAGTVNRTSDTTGTIAFTTNEGGTYYYQLVAQGSAEPVLDTSGSGIVCTTGSNTLNNPSNLVAGAMDAFIQEKDLTGNLSNVLKISISAYVAPVVVPVTPGGGGGGGGAIAPMPVAGIIQTTPAAVSTVIINGVPQESLATVSETPLGNQTVTTVQLDSEKVEEAIKESASSSTLTIPIDSNSKDIAVSTFDGALAKALDDKEMVLNIKTNDASYNLPIQELKIDELARQLGASNNLTELKVSVTIEAASKTDAKLVASATGIGKLTMVVQPVSFEITCTYNDKEVTINRFANYVERMIAVPSGVNANSITTAVVLNENGTLSQVPTKVVKLDGKYFVVINSLTNSTYTVISNVVTFTDMTTHWAKNTVNNMASRMIISGYGPNVFAPDQEITRAEFSSIVVKALGLRNPNVAISLRDVSTGSWYYDAIRLATQYGLVGGYQDGSFMPNQKITREEALVILSRVMKLAKMDVTISKEDIETQLAVFDDNTQVSTWAKEAVALGIKNSIVSGSNGHLYSKNNITRAETASIIMRVLQKAKLI